jgi:hypothetical protein
VDGCQFRVKPEVKIAYVHKGVGGYFIDDFIEGSFYQGTIAECEKWIEEHKPKQKTFRPFKDCDELVEFWTKNYQTGLRPAFTKPLIWVRLKCDGRERLIVAFGKGFGTDFVEIGNKAKAVPLQKLFDDYEFLDGCVIGVKNE